MVLVVSPEPVGDAKVESAFTFIVSPSWFTDTISKSKTTGSLIPFNISISNFVSTNSIPIKPTGIPAILNDVGGNSWIIFASRVSKWSFFNSTSKFILPISEPSNGILAVCDGKIADRSTISSESAVCSSTDLLLLLGFIKL